MAGLVILIDNLGSGGAQKQVYFLARELHSAGIDFQIVTYHQYCPDFYGQELESLGIKVTAFDCPSYGHRYFTLRRFLRKEKPETILSLLGGANIIACLLKAFLMRSVYLVVSD